MLVLHAQWHDDALHLWGESVERFKDGPSLQADGSRSVAVVDSEGTLATAVASASIHPFACDAQELLELKSIVDSSWQAERSELSLRLPVIEGVPTPGAELASQVGLYETPACATLECVAVPTIRVGSAQALNALLFLDSDPEVGTLRLSASVTYWALIGRFALDLLRDQRFIPTLIQTREDGMRAAWQPWLHDDGVRKRLTDLLHAMPPICRSAAPAEDDHPWSIVDGALRKLTDRAVRDVLVEGDFIDALDGRDAEADAHVAWLSGLLDRQDSISPPASMAVQMMRDAAVWVGRLDEGAHDQAFRLGLHLFEPDDAPLLSGVSGAGESSIWRLEFFIRVTGESGERVDASHIWSGGGGGIASIPGAGNAPEALLSELGRAGRLYERIELALQDATPSGVDLTTSEAYEFLTEHKPVLEESGFEVIAPAWWGDPTARIGARLLVEAKALDDLNQQPTGQGEAGVRLLGLNSLVQTRWQLAVGEHVISREQFEELVSEASPLVKLHGRWVEMNREDVRQVLDFLSREDGDEMTLLQAMQAAYGSAALDAGVSITGMDATGWVGELLGASSGSEHMPIIDQPKGFHGSLRPYQRIGLSWLAFLDQFGLGACLADDMGLGKTIQLIALLQHEREHPPAGTAVGPTLLVVPTSVVGNWARELERFAPALRVHIQHGPMRPTGKEFLKAAAEHDVIITTYALVTRDIESLEQVSWWRVALDEAQYIKNPPTKQTTAIRSLKAEKRLALTGTPVENRLSELWSIMEFCNPGYLGGQGEFRRRFAVPVERQRDYKRAEMLRQIVQPFVLRRLKTDPGVIDDLPLCVETKEFAPLTDEQMKLYEQTVKSMLGDVDAASGIQRRGLVLATLVKLKQICNHPAQALKDEDLVTGAKRISTTRSGKCSRLMALLEEVLAAGERALVFTQFRQMGDLLTSMLTREFDCGVQFLHGGTPTARRQQMIDAFQSENGPSIFVLSLKAGGVGLNLTAANHVFHFDRWWNPAVENQATDRAFRIGQTRTVHVHKFVCMGTLEERIDQMIERKTELADSIVGSGENWLADLNSQQLRDLLMLRHDLAGGEA